MIVFGASIVTLPFLARILGPANYGIMALLFLITGLMNTFTMVGLNHAISRYLPSMSAEEQNQTFSMISLTTFFSGVILSFIVLSSFYIAKYFDFLSFKFVILLSLYIGFLNFLSIIGGYFVGTSQFKKVSVYKTIKEVSTPVFACILAYFILIEGVIIGWLVAVIIASLLFITYEKRIFTAAVIAQFQKFRGYIVYGFPLMLNTIPDWAIHSIDRFFIEKSWGLESVGHYSFALTISKYGILLTPLIFMSIFPLVMRNWDSGKVDEAHNLIKSAFSLSFIIVILAEFNIYYFFDYISLIFGGERFLPSVDFILPLALSGLFLTITYFSTMVFAITKHTKKLFALVGTLAVLSVSLNYILIPLYGPLMAAYVYLLIFIIHSLASILVYNKSIRPFFDRKSYLLIVATALFLLPAMVVDYKLFYYSIIFTIDLFYLILFFKVLHSVYESRPSLGSQ
jgi:O-antigen/teichoic acid export membrane protein